MRFSFVIARRLRLMTMLAVCLCGGVSAQLQLVIDTLDASKFPTIRAKVKATSGGSAIRGLDVGSFTVFEDGAIMAPVTGSCEDTTNTGPVSAMLVIDRSGSMGPVFGSNAIVDAKRAAKGFVDRLSQGDEAALISFNSRPSYDQDWTQDKNILKARIDAIQTGGGTAIWDAIITAVSYLQPRSNRKVMILLTDGADGSSTSTFTAAREAVRNSGVTAYTIGLGSETNPQQLREIASVSGGKYYSAPDAKDLDEIYLAITSEIVPLGICELRYQSRIDCLDGSRRQVEVVLTYGGNTQRASAEYVLPYDSSTFSYATIALDENYSVEAGGSIAVPLELARITDNRPPTRFEFSIDYDKTLLVLDSATTTEITGDYRVTLQDAPGGALLRLSGGSPISRSGHLAILHFSSFRRLNSEKAQIRLSPPVVDRICTVARSRNGLITVVGVCEQALIRTNPVAGKLQSGFVSISPNPFNPSTVIEYRISKAGHASLQLCDVAGRVIDNIVSLVMPAGSYRQSFEAGTLAAGRYYLVLIAPDRTEAQPLLLVK